MFCHYFFSEGISSEILSWLEVKYLLRCKSVCKLWYGVIDNKQFVGMHATHYGRRSYHYIIDTETINNDGVKETIVDRVGEEGFLLVKRNRASDMPSAIYSLSNPSTKRILDLPDPHEKVLKMSIFQNSSTGSYYVFSSYKKNKEHEFELLDLGGQSNDPCPDANLSWKPVYISEIDRLRRQEKYIFSGIVCKGILYYLVVLKVGLSNPKIICFDLVKQHTCTTLDMPDQSSPFNRRELGFQLWRGRPAVSFASEEKLNIWVVEDYKKQKWADTIKIPLPSLTEYPSWNKVIPPYIRDNDGEDMLIIWGPLKPCWMYCPKSKKLSEFSSAPKRVRATLVSIKGMQPEKKEC